MLTHKSKVLVLFLSCTCACASGTLQDAKITKENPELPQEPAKNSWRLSSGDLIEVENVEGIYQDLQIISEDFHHLVVSLPESKMYCDGNWLSDGCTSWGSNLLNQCTKDWYPKINKSIVLKGRVSGQRSEEITIVDPLGKEHKAKIQEDGTFEAMVYRGGEVASKRDATPLKQIALKEIASIGPDTKLLWQFMPLINFPSAGLTFVKKKGTDTWFVGNVTPNSSAEKSGIRPGDIILSLNGISLEGRDKVTNIIQENSREILVKFQSCGPPQTVSVKRMPSVVFYASECCGPEGCFVPKDETGRAEEPRTCN